MVLTYISLLTNGVGHRFVCLFDIPLLWWSIFSNLLPIFILVVFLLVELSSIYILIYNMCGKESACQGRIHGLILGWGRSPWEGNGNPFQYSCLGNPMDKGGWRAIVRGVTKSQTWLSMHARIFRYITGNYFFPVCGLSLHFLNSILKAKYFNFMKLNCGVWEDSWESLGLQGDPTSPS